MRPQHYENATTRTSAVSPPTKTHAATALGKLYIFSNYQATVSSHMHRQRWAHSEHIEEFNMIARLKALSEESKSRVLRFVNELYAFEVEERKLREIGKSRKLLAQIWDNPDDAEYNNL